MLEPHMFGEVFVESVFKVMRTLGVERYCLLGGMYDSVPHTKPLIMTGAAEGDLRERLRELGTQPSSYEGPTTIASLIPQKAATYHIETMTLLVHVPQYTQLEEDHAAQLRLLETICDLYGFPTDLDKLRKKARRQYDKLDKAIDNEPELKYTIRQLERLYDSNAQDAVNYMPKLSPEIERFLNEIDKNFDSN
jgi:predicted ATP-grasp superfamily ATP-dependent carboligase